MAVFICVVSIILVFIVGFSYYTKRKNTYQTLASIIKTVQEKEKELNNLTNSVQQQQKDLKTIKASYDEVENRMKYQLLEYNKIQAEHEKLSSEAYAQYASVLEERYTNTEKEFDEKIKKLHCQLEEETWITTEKIKEIQTKLDNETKSYRKTQEVLLKEKRDKAEKEKFSIQLSDNEIADIKVLNELKPKLKQPRILSMLIWQTFVQKKLKKMMADIIGTSTVTGIYKITNLETSECYIGQSVDIARRWTDHAKCGLGIDTPAQNKLYQAIQKDGIWSFSWEVIEECSKEQLDERERFYINLFDTTNYGYNSTVGNRR